MQCLRRHLAALLGGLAWAGLALSLGACASGDRQAAVELADAAHPGDPYEDTNRTLLESNLWTYDSVVAPSVAFYRELVPEPLRNGLSNVIDNLAEPRIFINDLLQGELERAAVSASRFAFNTTIGFGGLFDRASQMGLEAHDEDFAQTLAVYGVEPGPYLVLPLLGPSNPRDALGRAVDMALDPANYLLFPVTVGANIVGTTLDRFARDPERLASLRATSMDFYTTLRDAYLQNRAYEIANGRPEDGGAPGMAQEDPLYDPLEDDLSELLDEEAPDEGRIEPSQGPAQAPTGEPRSADSRGRSGLSLSDL